MSEHKRVREEFPQQLHEYFIDHWLPKYDKSKYIYWSEGKEQIMFVRDTLFFQLIMDHDEFRKHPKNENLVVISTHISKSVELPVYQIERKDLGLRFVMRNNFYNWQLSVISENPIISDFRGFQLDYPKGFTTPPTPCSSRGYEGFPPEDCFGPYNENNKNFSIEISTDYRLYTFLFILMRDANAEKGS